MGRLSFRNEREVIEVPPDTAWWRARYKVELTKGWNSGRDSKSTVVGFLAADFPRSVPLHDDYRIKWSDDVVMIRLPCRPAPFWIPEQVKYEEWADAEYDRIGKYIRQEPNEARRLELVREQQRIRTTVPPRNETSHPSFRVLASKYAAWRVAPGEVAPIRPPDPGERYTCFKCLNYLGPPHYVDDCPAPVEHTRQWLRNKNQPHGVLKCKMEEVCIETPEDVLKVEWIDAKGQLWRRRGNTRAS